ncbi:DUF1570 domain-containing protein [Myxococcus sp. K38C18041901]|uniref:DUF1570 domain-containing protein n=1 Tax=Myxococcus guangdongensis TaxID=2906760 RepID=UPI0020A76F6A|nr:DUF1570 domain-containing protein [Myxococcus guangdongensis]MCP3063336.1 DUF1570 domain-containing protein [Myxococcus guangdongensis]
MAIRVGWMGLILALVSGCASSRALCPLEGGSPWTEARSQHFRVHTNLSPQAAKKAALELEKLRRAVLLAWGPDFDPEGSVDVIILRDEAELEEFSRGQYQGFSSLTPEGPLLVMAGEGHVLDAGPTRWIQTHELAHDVSRRVLLRQPRWLSEGLAQYLETTDVDDRTGEAVLGRAHWQSLGYVREHGWLDLDELWRWDRKKSLSQEEQEWRYHSAWLWVHYLINRHSQRFDAFQTRLALAEAPRAAWDAVFNDGVDLGDDLRTYATRGIYAVLTQPLPPISSDVTVRELDTTSVHAARARIFMHSPDGRAPQETLRAAQAEVLKGVGEDPNSVTIAVLAARLKPQRRQFLAGMRALVRKHPEDGRAWDLLAQYLDPVRDTAQREQAHERAATLRPQDVPVLVRLARHYDRTNQLEKGLAAARRAVQLAPGSPDALSTEANLSFQLGDCVAARKLQNRALDMLHESIAPTIRETMEARLQAFERQCDAIPPSKP